MNSELKWQPRHHFLFAVASAQEQDAIPKLNKNPHPSSDLRKFIRHLEWQHEVCTKGLIKSPSGLILATIMRCSAKPLVSSASFHFVGIPTMQDCLKVGCYSINPDLHPSGTPSKKANEGEEGRHWSNQIKTQLNTSITEIHWYLVMSCKVSVGRKKSTPYTEPSHVLLLTREFLLFSAFASFPYVEKALHFKNLKCLKKKKINLTKALISTAATGILANRNIHVSQC